MNAPSIFNAMVKHNRLPSLKCNSHDEEDITSSFSRFQNINKNPHNLETLIFIYRSNKHGYFFVSEENLKILISAYNVLDKDQSGTLDHKDFEDRNPVLHNRYQLLWEEIRKRMDVNNSQDVSQDEFIAFFIVWTLETDQCRMTTSGSFAQDLKEWRDAFNRQLRLLIDQFLIFQNNILTGSPVKG